MDGDDNLLNGVTILFPTIEGLESRLHISIEDEFNLASFCTLRDKLVELSNPGDDDGAQAIDVLANLLTRCYYTMMLREKFWRAFVKSQGMVI